MEVINKSLTNAAIVGGASAGRYILLKTLMQQVVNANDQTYKANERADAATERADAATERAEKAEAELRRLKNGNGSVNGNGEISNEQENNG